MSVLRVPTLAGCQFLEGPHTCLDVMWSLFWSKLDLKMKIWPTSGRFGENCLLKLVLVCPILTQWWNKKNWVYFPFKDKNQTRRWWGWFPSSLLHHLEPAPCSPPRCGIVISFHFIALSRKLILVDPFEATTSKVTWAATTSGRRHPEVSAGTQQPRPAATSLEHWSWSFGAHNNNNNGCDNNNKKFLTTTNNCCDNNKQ